MPSINPNSDLGIPLNPLRRLKLELPLEVRNAIVAQAFQEAPNECCGFLIGDVDGDVGKIRRQLPLVNTLESRDEFSADRKGLFEAHRTMRAESTTHLAIYHSHPTSAPIPSRRDIERNYYGFEIAWLILGMPLRDPKIGVWRLSENDFEPVIWRLVPAHD